MKYYISSAIVFFFGVWGACEGVEGWGIWLKIFHFSRGDHSLLSSELTVIIQGMLHTDAA